MNEPKIPLWKRFETSFTSTLTFANPFQDTKLTVTFTAPSGKTRTVDAFWDGGQIWHVRISPDEIGTWTYKTICSTPSDKGLHQQQGSFECGAADNATQFDQHGHVRVAANGRYLAHADGTPFFWMADTAWNTPLRATPEETRTYLDCRVQQKFTTVQWVTTQWVAAPDGDRDGQLAFTGHEKISINPEFFQRLDTYVEMIAQAGLLSVPIILWAVRAGEVGYDLPEDQAIRLARYIVARWDAYPVLWSLAGDGDYREEAFAERWRTIGRAVFNDRPHAPVTMHPAGMKWVQNEFENEAWYGVVTYQSGHGDDAPTLAWLVEGPPATQWQGHPPRPFINMEPSYEGHIAYQSKKPIDDFMVRRALYWSLLVSPTAGVTYGGHGVWGWDDGTQPPVGHPNTGIPLHWQKALTMPGAEQVTFLVELFDSIAWWQLQPAQHLLVQQPGKDTVERFIAVAQTNTGDLVVAYTPQDHEISLNLAGLPDDLSAIWFNPRTGQRHAATINGGHFTTPASGDWVLLLGRTVLLPAG